MRAACADEPSIAAQVLRLLAAHEQATGAQFLGEPPAQLFAAFGTGIVLTAGDRLGRYRLVRTVGRGGMGEVWLARDETLERDVAIKVVRDADGRAGDSASPASPRASESRVVREARAIARLDHPHVAGIYDVGETAEGALWLAMPYVAGGSLADRLRAGPLPWGEAVRLGRQLASALAAAHAQGIVHRDVKPANVLLDAAGHAKLADFGIATLANATVQTQLAMGTIGYAAPEQLDDAPVDGRADLWALGITLYESLTGRRPFEGETTLAVLGAILHASPRPLPLDRGIPSTLAALIEQLLAKEPAQRPSSAVEVEAALTLIERGDLSAPEARASQPNRPRTNDWRTANASSEAAAAPRSYAPRRHRPLVALAIAATAVAAIAGGWMTLRPASGTSATSGSRDTISRAATRAEAGGPELASVAVLPFENLAHTEADAPFADGLTDEVISALGRREGLRVASRTAAFAFRDRRLGTRALGDSLGVAHLLEAGVRRDGRRLRVTARLVRASDGRIVWSRDYDRDVRDVFAVQGELAGAIATALAPRLADGSPEPTITDAPAGTADVEAYDLFLRARWLTEQRTAAPLRTATELLEAAVARDPGFARGWAALASARLMQVVFADARPADYVPRALRETERALALDSLLGEGHGTLSHLLRIYEYDWAGSAAAGARAVTLAPNDAQVRITYALTLLQSGRAAEALRILEPMRRDNVREVGLTVTTGRAQLALGDVASAVASLREATRIRPRLSFAHQSLGYALLAAGRPTEALGAFRSAAMLGAPRDSAHLAWALATVGDTVQARAIVRRIETGRHNTWSIAVGLAVAYEGLGDRDAAFAWLDRAWRERAPYLDAVGVLPSLRALRGDARWPAFAVKIGLR